MIRLIEALNYRCLRDMRQEVGPFQVLVGANGSGKSSFLDVLVLFRDLLNEGLRPALGSRSPGFQNLLWMESGDRFELAIEMDIPEERRHKLPQNGFERCRYEIAVGLDSKEELAVLAETLWLKPVEEPSKAPVRLLFPTSSEPRATIFAKEARNRPRGHRKVISKKVLGENHYFRAETTDWNNPFRLGPQRLGLVNLPEDEQRFPIAVWVKKLLMEGIDKLVLNSEAMRRPSPPGSPRGFQADGSNLPWVLEALRKNRDRFDRWIAHVKTAIPDIEDVVTIEREEDKHRYLRVHFSTGLRAPSWVLSDGTLRLLALTLLAYIEEPGRVFVIEEPENGIHPQAVETVFQSLSSAYDSQILCASHSPVVLSLAKPDQVLCFARSREGATDVVRGDQHPNLKDWKYGADLGTLFATGVLG